MGAWHQSLFGCFSNFDVAFYGFLVCQPCTLGSMIAFHYQENFSFLHFLLGLIAPWSLMLRSDIRLRESIPGSACDDCIKTVCCYPCSFCQVTKQYADRGCKFFPISLA
ncbi:putative PLAC8 family [Monocercomonoides exilis]|uniref:putative PLAC8 family n=1 Tax=Monocercomonoides exilis TaxID=2049356 RepID=UPI00355A02F5|nr:putative PLAC8 family [Monocercomonoides exilis]